jgi:diacylglycerol kinase
MNRDEMMGSHHRARNRTQAFRYAFAGLWYVLRTQRNAWIHTIATVIVIFLGVWLQVGRQDWVLLILAIFIVWQAEIINTALEAITDLASPEDHPLARVGKDVGAGAVLLASVSAFILGMVVFLPALKEKLNSLGM